MPPPKEFGKAFFPLLIRAGKSVHQIPSAELAGLIPPFDEESIRS
jgi:hypothetical protein